MPIRFFDDNRPRRRGSRRKAPATKRQREKLQDQMEHSFRINFNDGIRKLRDGVSAKKLEETFRSGAYGDIMELIPFNDLEDYMQPAIDKLAQTISDAGNMARTEIPANLDKQLRLTTQNDALNDYLDVRTGALIQNVKDDTQVMVQQAVRGAFQGGLTPADVASQIKDGIGLNERQAQAYQNFQGTKKEKAAYLDRLQEQRANMVARTEISFAANQGQLAAYKAMKEQGLVSADTRKTWIVDGSPCPKICDPMDGVQVYIDADFMLPDGSTVPCPPAHPNCRCLQALEVGDNTTSNRDNYKAAESSDDEGPDSDGEADED